MTSAQHTILLAGLLLALSLATARSSWRPPAGPAWRCPRPIVIRWQGRLLASCSRGPAPPVGELLRRIGVCVDRLPPAQAARPTDPERLLELVVDARGGGCVATSRPLPGELRLALGLRIDVNRATAEDLEALPRIGPVLAQRIVEHRGRQGKFAEVAALRAVKGIGPVTLSRIRPYLVAGPSPRRRR